MDTILYGISVVLSGLGFYLSMDRLFTHLSSSSTTVVANIALSSYDEREAWHKEPEEKKEEEEEEEEEEGEKRGLIQQDFVIEAVTSNGLLVLKPTTE